ncbi:hypothetical protein [Rhodohalobacter mucosus]|uniref:Uncharacterized protein n=1 Tax=Rhodohalobacter mucosus TaxID=2079485 RepID=A0A316TXX3_9BACT|nr:hypothetical protein [Rhodohalobacter mucosus]PWN07582.1 hypothetical protein DDZ15_04815 [Rhodohalobacter mucosus]
MNISLREDEVISGFILDYSDQCLNGAEELSFKELLCSDNDLRRAVDASDVMPRILRKLPQKGVSDLFDRKMAAAFAMELEKENSRLNAAKSCSKRLSANRF